MKIFVFICLIGVICCNENCGGVPYDLVKSICCMGSILDRDESDAKCCSKEYISIPPPGPSSTHNPHGGIPPIDKPPRVYNSRTHICCNYVDNRKIYGNIFKRKDNAKCCDDDQYNNMTQLCHNGNIIIDIPYHNNQPLMCGDTLYDGRRKTCCSDLENNVFALHNKVGDGECCKSVLYNRQDHLCCNGIVHHRPANGECCGDQAYDSEHYICCGSAPHAVQAIPFNLKPAACCKGSMYSIRDHNCCNGVLSHKVANNQCCDTRPYDSLKSICCAGQVKARSDNSKCCGYEVYNELTHACCNGVICNRPPNAIYKVYN